MTRIERLNFAVVCQFKIFFEKVKILLYFVMTASHRGM